MRTSQTWGLTYHEEETGDERQPLAVVVPVLPSDDTDGARTYCVELVV